VTNTNSGSNGAVGVIAAVQRDHREIEQLFATVESTRGDARREAFEDLVRKLAVHETAEEEVVHPLAKDVGADDVAQDVLAEEDEAKTALSNLDGMDVTSADFGSQLEQFKSEVIAHATHEEREEHPRIMANTEPEKLEKLERVFEMAEKTAPTRPHPSAPESRAGNLALGPILAVTDRVRDALRGAMNH